MREREKKGQTHTTKEKQPVISNRIKHISFLVPFANYIRYFHPFTNSVGNNRIYTKYTTTITTSKKNIHTTLILFFFIIKL